ncbi:MFS transporter [Cutaneotrichosporon oleaginosum]|uniref:MFS transporter n=1 Tax=Cutaneotrichosporon oleaginosum TaxID=879819 RepID=A0A0J0XQ33_9TREE|nr:MFS transporter [Cutaneotrichosporon oleaginosum]KLT43231.1 MFS transporter [Cutaneotrichosporon oleaginosum]TXT09912.1 hypothetical protein COLE_03846 [Cutaneotrichosporon oleaginosum]
MRQSQEKPEVEHRESIDDIEKVAPVEELPLDPKMDRRVKLKIDFILMPVLCFIYALNYLDKTALTYASVMGLFKDTGINGTQYSWVASIYYFGYLVGAYPMVIGLQRFPSAKFTAINIVIWGVAVACTALCKNYAGLLGLRFMLGVFEAVIYPAIVMITAEWYKPREQGTRTGVWGSMTAWGCILGGAVAYALVERQTAGTLAIPGWEIVFIWLGAMTVFCGVVFFFFVPDSIEKAWFLDAEEKAVAHRRTLENKQHIGEREWKWYQVRECLRDPQCYLLLFVTICSNIPTGGLTNFFALIVQGLGFTPAETLLLTMGNATLGIATMVLMFAGDKARCRSLVSGLGPLISIAGAAMLWALPAEKKIARLIGFFLCIWNSIATYIITSFITTNIAGRTKKSVMSGAYLVVFCVGNLIGPQTFREKYAPRYAPALITHIALTSTNVCLFVVLFLYYRRENARRDREHGPVVPVKKDEWVDLTDVENETGFRYVY